MVKACAVKGCKSESYGRCGISFHSFPKDEQLKAKWTEALAGMVTRKNPFICSHHFRREDFRMTLHVPRLNDDAVPSLTLPKVNHRPYFGDSSSDDEAKSIEEPCPDLSECSEEEETKSELVACRVCLATGGWLYAISGSGLEDLLAALTGVALSEEVRFPRHLCAFCRERLSKYAAFRDSCQRSTALLQALLEKGPLKMDDIKAIDRESHKLTNNLACHKVYEFETNNMMSTAPVIKTEDFLRLLKEPEHMEIEYLESEDFMDTFGIEQKLEQVNTNIKEVKLKSDQTKNEKVIKSERLEKVDLNNENFDPSFEIGDDYTGNVTDTSEEIDGLRKKVVSKKFPTKKVESNKVPTKKVKSNKVPTKKVESNRVSTKQVESHELPPQTDMREFEEKFNVEYTFVTEEEQMQEIEDRKRNNKLKYCCDLCGRGFRREHSIITHMWRHDPSLGAFACAVCGRRARTTTKLRRHRRTHGDRYRCRECGFVTRDRPNARAHSLVHRGGRFACPHCPAVYARQHSLCNHVRTTHPRHNQACERCGETFASAKGVRQHAALVHRQIGAMLKCRVCKVTFLTAEALQRHKELRVGVSHAAMFPCGACGDSCGSDAARAAHMADKHPPSQHYCEECDKTFADAASFALHTQRKHYGWRAAAAPFRRRTADREPGAGATRFVCEMCGRVLESLAHLTQHRNGHLRPFACPDCGKRFGHKLTLRIHMRVHTGERPYQCEQCPRTFAMQCNYKRHVKNFHERAKATCPTCGKVMNEASLAAHVRSIHLGFAPPPRTRGRKPGGRGGSGS